MSEEFSNYGPSYQQIKDAVQSNISRMHNSGESHLMMARWLSYDIDNLCTQRLGEPAAWLVKIYDNDGCWVRDDLRLIKPFVSSASKNEIIPLYAPYIQIKESA